MCEEVLRFPDGFLWGAVTYAHQVEGHTTNNDRYEWEKRRERRRVGSGTCREAFEHYARRAVRSFGANIHHWVAINAPVLYTYRGTWRDQRRRA